MFLYNDYTTWVAKTFGHKIQKIAIDAGFTCPNRDGTKARGGCVFCDNKAFNPPYCSSKKSIRQQLEEGKLFFSTKGNVQHYLAYFQAYSNTYAPLSRLRQLYEEALSVEGVDGIVIATRPDCVDNEILDYLQELNSRTFVEIEYGVESVNDDLLRRINRQHDFSCSREAITATHQRGITTGAHLIIGLPGQSREEILQEAETVSALDIDILKIHQLQVIRDTQLAKMYEIEPFHVLELDEYITLLAQFLRRVGCGIVIERLVSTSPANRLIAPHWGVKANEVALRLKEYMHEKGYHQGDLSTETLNRLCL